MQLLSALTSTTSPLAMQAMPAVAPPTADFAALLAGMVPADAGAAQGAADMRQIAARPGKGLPLPVAAPKGADATPPLPVSATEAVLMLPTGATGTLARLLPDRDAPPPEPEPPAVPVLPTPPRFAVPLPRGRKPEAEVPRERPAETMDDGDAEPVVADTARAVEPEVTVPADAVIILPAPPHAAAPLATASPPVQTIGEDGSVIATDPATPMRPAKRTAPRATDTAAPMAQAVDPARVVAGPGPAAGGSDPQPAIGRTTPLPADGIVPVHVVVPQPRDAEIATAPPPQVTAPVQGAPSGAAAAGQRSAIDAILPPGEPAMPVRQQLSTRDIGEPVRSVRDAVAPVAMPDTAIPSATTVLPAAASPPVATPAVAPDAATTQAPLAATPRPPVADMAHDDIPAAAAVPGPVARDATMAAQVIPQPAASIAPLPGVAMQAPVDSGPRRGPIAGEAAAPVVPVAPPGAPVAGPLPVTRIAMPTPAAEPVAAPAIVDAAAPAPRPRRDEDGPALPAAAAALDPAMLRPVAAPMPGGQAALDTRQPQWMEGMIDRIETLREATGTAGETRIRLSPDALGDIEIAIRTGDDGKVHVHFNSENADAGRLLADAQPRLVQLAEARGLKLGGMQVDVGTQQQPQRHAQEQGNAPPRAPRSAAATAGQPSTNDNQRIA